MSAGDEQTRAVFAIPRGRKAADIVAQASPHGAILAEVKGRTGLDDRWVGDTTEFAIGESGKLYLAVLLDLCSRFVVGWALSAVNDRHLTLKGLAMALKRCCPDSGLLHHSDQGCTYASEDYQGCSMHTASPAA